MVKYKSNLKDHRISYYMKKVLLFLPPLFLLLPLSHPLYAQSRAELENFKTYNPDGQKYTFAKDYVMGLKYIHLNTKERTISRDLKDRLTADLVKVKKNIDDLVKENVNLRVARNILSKYDRSSNGLILKVATLFIEVCNSLIELNNKERELWESILTRKSNAPLERVESQYILDEQTRIANDRKERLRGLLESSFLVTKVLVSHQPDDNGELTHLGITRKERRRLLSRLQEFKGEEFEGGARPGQTYVEAAVATLRDFLEDYSWQPLDG